MDKWLVTSLILCVFGFLKEFRPIDAYYTQFLIGPWHNYTEAQLYQQIFPLTTYSELSCLVAVFLLTDLLRYKPVILVGAALLVLSAALLTVGRVIEVIQLMSVCYGGFMAADVAYFTYIYAMVDPQHYQKVTSYTQAAMLVGRFMGSVVAQVLISTGATGLYELNYITIAATASAFCWAFLLPPATRSIYFHTTTAEDLQSSVTTTGKDEVILSPNGSSKDTDISTILSPAEYVSAPVSPGNKKQRGALEPFKRLWRDLEEAYTNPYVLKWCLWWSLSSCIFYQLYMYIQVLWEVVNTESVPDRTETPPMYNGAIEGLCTIIGAAAAVGCGWLRLDWRLRGEAVLSTCALLQGGALLFSALTPNLWVAYCGFLVFGVLYYTMITIVNSEIAKNINEDSYGLVFGINTFLALLLQTILTIFVAGDGGLKLDIRTQFVVYGGYMLVLGVVFGVRALMVVPLWLTKKV